jgi:tetratricopeptide (TPR) repeat protein
MQYVHSTIDDMILDAIHAHNSGELEKAENIYTQILNANPNEIVKSVIFKHRGMAFFAQNKYQEALADFKKSIEYDSKNFRSYYYIGIVYSLLDDDEAAIEFFNKSLEINEYQSHVYYRKALSEYHLCDFKSAMEALKKAKKLGLDDDDVQKLYENLSAKLELQF